MSASLANVIGAPGQTISATSAAAVTPIVSNIHGGLRFPFVDSFDSLLLLMIQSLSSVLKRRLVGPPVFELSAPDLHNVADAKLAQASTAFTAGNAAKAASTIVVRKNLANRAGRQRPP